MKALITAVLLTLITACGTFDEFADGYQLWDVSKTGYKAYKKISKAKAIYCADSLSKLRGNLSDRVSGNEDAMATLTKYGIDYEDEGFCAIQIAWELG